MTIIKVAATFETSITVKYLYPHWLQSSTLNR